MKTLLIAEFVAPMTSPIVREAGVVFDRSRILAVASARALRQQHPDATLIDAGSAIILPGLVNPHVHLELSWSHRFSASCVSFVDWLEGIIRGMPQDPEARAAKVEQAVSLGVGQCLRFGVTAVGDISRQSHLTRSLLRRTPLRVVSYGEIQAMAQRRGLLEARLAAAIDTTHASDRLQIGVSPHAPYSVEEAGYRRCLQIAIDRHFPLATHLAESADEAAFLATHTGPFRGLWDWLGVWDSSVPTFPAGPIRFAKSVGLLDHPTLLAHVNYCDDEEMGALVGSPASVIYCPRTHAFFNHPPHRFRRLLERGINVAVGTDSCASSPDLNLVDELRLVHRIAPEMAPQDIWEMATCRAARAVLARNLGVIETGCAPDFVLFDVTTADPLREILERPDLLPTSVWIEGQRITAT